MTLGEFVGSKYAEGTKFPTFAAAVDAYRASGSCQHNNTCFGQCTDCGATLNVEGTFVPVNPDKSRYLDARRS